MLRSPTLEDEDVDGLSKSRVVHLWDYEDDENGCDWNEGVVNSESADNLSPSTIFDDEEILDDFVVANVALAIPVVLDSIFANLSVRDLKKIRLVCQAWNGVGAKHLGRKTVLDFCSLMPCSRHIPVLVLNSKLAIRVELSVDDYDSEEVDVTGGIALDDRVSIFSSNFLNFVSQLHQRIEEFYLTVDPSFLNTLLQALAEFKFPKLNTLCINLFADIFDFSDDHHSIPPRPAALPILSALRTLKLEDEDGLTEQNLEDCPTVFQQIVTASAYNLHNLTVKDNVFPDLNACTQLRRLEFHGSPFYQYDHPHLIFPIEELNRMLEEVKGSLEELVLGMGRQEESSNIINPSERSEQLNKLYPLSSRLAFPKKLPKLVSLTISSLNVFHLPTNCNLGGMRLPNLSKLSLGSPGGGSEHLERVLNSLPTYQNGITCLKLCGDLSPRAIQRSQKLFPTLSKLEFDIIMTRSDVEKLQELMTAYNDCGWNVKDLTVTVRLQFCKLSAALPFLQVLATVKGLKLVNFMGAMGRVNLKEVMELLLYCKDNIPFLKLHGLLVHKQLVKDMEVVIKEEKLPIELIGNRMRTER